MFLPNEPRDAREVTISFLSMARFRAKPSSFFFHCLYLSRVMKRANTEVYDQIRKVKKDLVRRSKSLREVESKSKARETKAAERLTHKHARDVALAVDAATSATQMELKKVHLPPRFPELVILMLTVCLEVQKARSESSSKSRQGPGNRSYINFALCGSNQKKRWDGVYIKEGLMRVVLVP